MNYNPTRGGINDGLESMIDYFGGTTGMAKDTGDFLRTVTTARGSEGSNFANHSQGNLLTLQGYKYIANKGGYETGGFKNTEYFFLNRDKDDKRGVPTIAGFGSPASVESNGIFDDKKLFQFIGNSTQAGDPVAQILGGNTGQNDTIDGYLNRFKGFSGAAHSDYKCSDLKGAQCGPTNP
ncbi:hypothetical protein [Shewanella sp.]|uniref:hypothetical protein n=1 Tax=Shewanella sp. TaxID=50422 RepID=UPI004053CE8C